MRRRWPWVLAGLLGAGALGLRSETAERVNAQLLEAGATRVLGEDVRVGRVEVHYFPAEVVIRDVRVLHPATGELIADVDALHAAPMPWRPWRLGTLEVDRPDVLLHVDAGGLREFRRLPESSGPPSDRFPWETLVVRDARVVVVHSDARVEVSRLSFVPGAARVGTVEVGAISVDVGGRVQVARDVVVPGVTLAPDRVVVPALQLPFDDVRVDADLAAFAGGPLTGAVSVRADLPNLLAPLGRPPVALGTLWLDAELAGTTARPGISGVLRSEGVVLDPTLDAPVRLGDATMKWRLALPDAASTDHASPVGDASEGGATAVAASSPVTARLVIDDLSMAWARGRIVAHGEVDLDTYAVEGHVEGAGLHLADILRDLGAFPTPWVDLTGDVALDVRGTALPLAMEGPFDLDVADLRVDDGPLGARGSELLLRVDGARVRGRTRFDARTLAIDGDRIEIWSAGGHRSEGSARTTIGLDGGRLDLDVDFPRLDLAQLAPLADAELAGIAQVEGWLGGSYDAPFDARADVSVTDLHALGFPLADQITARLDAPGLLDLAFEDVHGVRGRTRYDGRFGLSFAGAEPRIDLDLDVPEGRVADLVSVAVDLPGVDGAVTGHATLAGTAYRLDGDITTDFTDLTLWGEGFPVGTGRARFADGLFTLDTLDLTRDAAGGGQERLSARGGIGRAWALDLDVGWEGATLERLDAVRGAEIPLTGAVAVNAHVGGDLDTPRVDGALRIPDLRWDGVSVGSARAEARTENGAFQVAARVDEAARRGVDDPGSLAVVGSVAFPDAARPPEPPTGTEGENARVGDWTFDATATRFPLHALWPTGAEGSPLDLRIDGAARVHGDGDDAVPVQLHADVARVEASWRDHRVALHEPTSLDWSGGAAGAFTLAPTRITGRRGDDPKLVTDLGFHGTTGEAATKFFGGGHVDLDLARFFVPGLVTARGTGRLTVDIARGEDGSLRPTASLGINGTDVLTEYVPATLEGLRATVEASPDGYLVRRLGARVGGGTLESAESRIDAVGWVPTRYALHGTLTDATVKFFDDLPPITGDARLRFDGTPDELLLAGDIDVDRMDFRDRIDWEAMVLSLREERLTVAAPDETGRYFALDLGVRADGTVHLRNNVANADASGTLRVLGDTQRPGVVGEISVLPGGRVFLHDREFDVVRGEVRYVDPYSYDPQIDFVLDTTVRAPEQDYRVSYLVSGPFSDWHTETNADPWLSQADVNALLLFGVTRAELDRVGGLGTALVAETSDLLLAQTALARFDTLVDRWSLVSGASERGSSTVSSELRFVAEKRVGDLGFTVEKALGASLGNDWYASVEQRLAHRLYVTAYAATRQEGRALPLGAAYGAEFKLRWEFDGD